MSGSLSTTALITVAEYKEYDHDLRGEAEDTRIELLINTCSDLIENATNGVVYIQRSFSEDYGAGNNPWTLGGAKRIYLRHYPIVSVSSITDDESNTVDSDDYTVVSEKGILEHDSSWPAPIYRWTIAYTAGKAGSRTVIDQRVKLACMIEVYKRVHMQAVSVASKSRSGRAGSKNVSFNLPTNPTGLSDDAYALIAPDIARWV